MQKQLENRFITLAPLVEQHRDFFIALANIPAINHRINKPLPYEAEHFSLLLNQIQGDNRYFTWVIEHEGLPCGIINAADLRNINVWQGGYWLHSDYWGMGLASSALNLVKTFLFGNCGAERVQAIVEPDNMASIRVLEKCGYQREGVLRKFYPLPSRGLIDIVMYACISDSPQQACC